MFLKDRLFKNKKIEVIVIKCYVYRDATVSMDVIVLLLKTEK